MSAVIPYQKKSCHLKVKVFSCEAEQLTATTDLNDSQLHKCFLRKGWDCVDGSRVPSTGTAGPPLEMHISSIRLTTEASRVTLS